MVKMLDPEYINIYINNRIRKRRKKALETHANGSLVISRNTIDENLRVQGLKWMRERERNLETCSQRGALRVASRKVESISDRILRSASVSSLGHLFPDEEDELPPPNPPPSSAAAENLISSSIFAGGLELIGEASSTTSLPPPPPPPCSISRFTNLAFNPPLLYSIYPLSFSLFKLTGSS